MRFFPFFRFTDELRVEEVLVPLFISAFILPRTFLPEGVEDRRSGSLISEACLRKSSSASSRIDLGIALLRREGPSAPTSLISTSSTE